MYIARCLRIVGGLLILCLLSTAPNTARATEGEELDQLMLKVHQLIANDKYREAEPLARQFVQRVERSPNANIRSPKIIALALGYLGESLYFQKKTAEAEKHQRRALALCEKGLGEDDPATAEAQGDLARTLTATSRFAEAEDLFKRAIATQEKKSQDPEIRDKLGDTYKNLAGLYADLNRFAEAEPLYKRSIAIFKELQGEDDLHAARITHNLAILYSEMGRLEESERLEHEALAVMEKRLGPNDPQLSYIINSLALRAEERNNYAEAEKLLQRTVALASQKNGPDDIEVASCYNNFGNLYTRWGKYRDAKENFERALAIEEKALGPNSLDVATVLNNLSVVYLDLGRLPEAEQLLRRALKIQEAVLGEFHGATAHSLTNLGAIYATQGRYAEAEALHKRALAVREKVFGPDHPGVALSAYNLAHIYHRAGRNAEAEPLVKRSLAIRRKAYGEEHRDVASSLIALSSFYSDSGRYEEADAALQTALRIQEKLLGPDHESVASTFVSIAAIRRHQQCYDEAESLAKKALAITEKALGGNHADCAFTCSSLAETYLEQERFADAEPLLDRGIQLTERGHVYPSLQCALYEMRAKVAWHDKRASDALNDLRRAMEIAEQMRGQASGAAHERAASFSQYASAFELMVRWQAELGDVSEALSAIERGRARGLLDDMQAAGVDLQAGRSTAEREQLAQRELDLKSRIGELEKEVDNAPPEKRAAQEKLLADAREALYEFNRDQRSTSPVYRSLLTVGANPVRLRQLQRTLSDTQGLMLIYALSDEDAFVLVVRGDTARLEKLQLTDQQALALAVEAGPLSRKRLDEALAGVKDRPGVIPQLSHSRAGAAPVAALSGLWEALIPEQERNELTSGHFERLIVVPDGPLSLLPFETLVVENSARPKYLLDLGPALFYAPSATVLFNLSEERKSAEDRTKEPLLTVADPNYPQTAVAMKRGAAPAKAPVELTAKARYAGLGGTLNRLPYTGQESRWLAKSFQEHGLTALALLGAQATEAAVRQQVVGREIIHLACHGLTDQEHANFFGALALTPNKPSDPADDGFLTLPEIYELNLKGCELAILSACETNYGPQQQGEGVWALSRGFLVAGSRRVVASNWLVDDEAAASLISYFAAGIAQQQAKGEKVDYARALQEAKRWVRKQAKWQSPYYWATFELIGPN
ncbi:MAG: CHAT domain-containing tetratricopeptide repeat protein [Singulisphaera sp.]